MYNNLYKINKHREKLQVDKKKKPRKHIMRMLPSKNF